MNNYEVITNAIIKKLEEGVIPWQKPYQGMWRWQKNFKSGKRYNGINQISTSMMKFNSPYWLTYKQAKELGGTVIKGSKGSPILFAKLVDYKDANDVERTTSIYRRTFVFNLDNIDGIDCPHLDDYGIEEIDFNPIENCVKALEDSKPNRAEIEFHTNNIAYYSPGADMISCARPETFVSEEAYYSTIFHEIIHSTGHSSRLNRDMTGEKGGKKYAKEELIAEIGASFAAGLTGIATATLDNSVAYIEEWKSVLRDNPQLIVIASSKAQKAVDSLKLKDYETKEEHNRLVIQPT